MANKVKIANEKSSGEATMLLDTLRRFSSTTLWRAYSDGGRMGRLQGAAWMEDGRGGNGNTLKRILTSYVERFANARGALGAIQRELVLGEMSGFSMWLESPEFAAEVDAYAKKNRAWRDERPRDLNGRYETVHSLERLVPPDTKRKRAAADKAYLVRLQLVAPTTKRKVGKRLAAQA